MSLKFKLPLLLMSLAILPLVAAGAFSFRDARALLVEGTVKKLEAIAGLQEKRLNEGLALRLESMRLIASQAFIRILDDAGKPGGSAEASRIQTIIADAKRSISSVDDISIYDADGSLVASTDPAVISQPHGLEERFRTLGSPELSDVFKDESNRLRVRLVAPLFQEGRLVGVMEMITTADFLIAVTEDHTGLGQTGEVTFVMKNKAGDAVFLTPLRFDAGAALARAMPRERSDGPFISALGGKEDVFFGDDIKDYRDKQVVAVTRYIDALGWGMVVKIDRDEALAPVDTLLRDFLLIMLVTALLSLALAGLLSRIIVGPITKLILATTELQKGDLTVHAPDWQNDEIGVLGRSFNNMVAKLNASYATFDEKIADRTLELQRRTAALETSRSATLNILEDLNNERGLLAVTKAKDEAMLASIGDCVVATDTQGRIMLVNAAFERVLGWEAAEVAGKMLTDVISAVDEMGVELEVKERPIGRVLQGSDKVMTTTTVYYQRKDGTRFPVAITVGPILMQGKRLGVIEVFRDITKEKDIDKAKTEFVSLASHQLRTPLSMISWYTEMLLDGDAGKMTVKQKKLLQEVYQGNRRMVELVDALLNVSRLELGTFTIMLEPVDFARLVTSVIDEQRPQIDQKKLDLTLNLAEDIPTMQADPNLLRIVFQNLLSNAVKYTPETGKIAVSLSMDGRKGVLLKVTDTGYGIPQNQQSKIFSKLFRADNAKAKDTQGTGLGLYIAKSILDNSGGKIWFKSEEDIGSSFYVSVPLDGMKKEGGTIVRPVRKA